MAQAFPDNPAAHDGGYTRAQGTQVAGDVVPMEGYFSSMQKSNSDYRRIREKMYPGSLSEEPKADILRIPTPGPSDQK